MGNALRYRARRDDNESAIVQALQAVGCSVMPLPGGEGRPDLLVGRAGVNYLLEVKGAAGTLTPAQVQFHGTWQGRPVAVVRTRREALQAVEILS